MNDYLVTRGFHLLLNFITASYTGNPVNRAAALIKKIKTFLCATNWRAGPTTKFNEKMTDLKQNTFIFNFSATNIALYYKRAFSTMYRRFHLS